MFLGGVHASTMNLNHSQTQRASQPPHQITCISHPHSYFTWQLPTRPSTSFSAPSSCRPLSGTASLKIRHEQFGNVTFWNAIMKCFCQVVGWKQIGTTLQSKRESLGEQSVNKCICVSVCVGEGGLHMHS